MKKDNKYKVDRKDAVISFDFTYGTMQNAAVLFMSLNPDAVMPSELGATFSSNERSISPSGIYEFMDGVETLIGGLTRVYEGRTYEIFPKRSGNDDEEYFDCEESTELYEDKYCRGKGNMFAGVDDDICAVGSGNRMYTKKYGNMTAVISMSVPNIKFIYDSTADAKAISDLRDDFMKVCMACKNATKKVNRSRIFQISVSNGSYYLTPAKISYSGTLPFEDLYPDEFMPVAENIDKFVKNGKSGMIILHGLQGSGKTSYIRKLISDNTQVKFVYLPMAMAGQLSSPDFISFMQESLSNSVIVIEDCEQLLESRTTSGSSSAISALLNMSDGLLSDGLNIKFICTFNAEINRIDKALLRKGRLVDKYEFGKLPMDKAKKLAEKIYGDPSPVTSDMSLAEIFNINEENHSGEQLTERKRIGFY